LVGAITPWTASRDEWVRQVSSADLARVIAKVSEGSRFDENVGDVTERAGTIRWLAARGREGTEWGHAGAAAEDLGLWRP
jgi:hypothetical protein